MDSQMFRVTRDNNEWVIRGTDDKGRPLQVRAEQVLVADYSLQGASVFGTIVAVHGVDLMQTDGLSTATLRMLGIVPGNRGARGARLARQAQLLADGRIETNRRPHA